jgi:hypothetical protein
LCHFTHLKIQFGKHIAELYFSTVDHWFPESGLDSVHLEIADFRMKRSAVSNQRSA